jgi:arsenic resistance protein ArsH
MDYLKDETFTLRPKQVLTPSTHPPRILILRGSLREKSFSLLLTFEARRILEKMGADVKHYDPLDRPVFDQKSNEHAKVHELRGLGIWSEGQVWSSPEMHENISGVMKNQIDSIPLAVMEVSGGSQSFNAVNTLRFLGRWMRMITIPNQSSVAQAYQEF